MKADQFKQLIRSIVKEEIKKSLPILVPQIVAEALSGKLNKSELIENRENEDFFENLKSEIPQKATQKPKQTKLFSSNPLLNQVLNETEGGVPPDVSFGSQIPRPNFKQGSQPLNVQVPQTSNILNEETKAQAEIGAFKDYRKLMKAIDVKKKQGSFGGGNIGGLSIDPGVPTDFSTID